MDSFDLAVILAAVLGVVLILLAYLKGKSGDEQESGGERQVRAVPQERPPGAVAAGVPRRAAARNARARMRIGAQRRQEDRDDDEDAGWGGGGAVGGPGGSSSEDEGAELEDLVAMPDGKVGAKKRKKLEMKAEKRANREAELAEREERKEREDRKRQEQEKRDEKLRAVEKQKEDEEKARKEEEAKREQEEYERLKAEFAVEEEGFDENENPEEAESLLQKFVDFIKEKKIVRLEVIAAEFKLRIQDVINRIEELLKDGSLTGVLDDRGKFIWVTEEELLAVAKFIKQRGRVSIAELAENSNALIKFPEDVKA